MNDNNYVVVIHCDSKEARDEVLADLKAINDELDILNRVRDEIKHLPSYGAKFANGDFALHVDKKKVLRIIDKYIAERRDKE